MRLPPDGDLVVAAPFREVTKMSEDTFSEIEAGARRRSGGGRSARHAKRAGGNAPTAMPFIRRSMAPFNVLTEEGLEQIEANADRVLEEIGIEFRDYPDALTMWKNAGADVDGERVRFPKGLVREVLKTAPPVFTQHARNPQRSVQIGGDATVFAPVYGPPFIRSLEEGRRYATIDSRLLNEQ